MDGHGFPTPISIIRAPSAQYACSPDAPLMASLSKKIGCRFPIPVLLLVLSSASLSSLLLLLSLLHLGSVPPPPALAIPPPSPPPTEEKQHQQQALEVACPPPPLLQHTAEAPRAGTAPTRPSPERHNRSLGLRPAARGIKLQAGAELHVDKLPFVQAASRCYA